MAQKITSSAKRCSQFGVSFFLIEMKVINQKQCLLLSLFIRYLLQFSAIANFHAQYHFVAVVNLRNSNNIYYPDECWLLGCCWRYQFLENECIIQRYSINEETFLRTIIYYKSICYISINLSWYEWDINKYKNVFIVSH